MLSCSFCPSSFLSSLSADCWLVVRVLHFFVHELMSTLSQDHGGTECCCWEGLIAAELVHVLVRFLDGIVLSVLVQVSVFKVGLVDFALEKEFEGSKPVHLGLGTE